MITSKTIVLIHGNFVNNLTWANWKPFFEARGFTVHTPVNPGHEGHPAALRETVHPDLTKTGFVDVVTNIAKLIETLPEKPIVIGHSMAGAAVLKLVEMGITAAGVSIDGAPPKNVMPPFSTVKIAFPAFGFFTFKKYFMGSRNWYDRAFFNTLPESERSKAFNDFAVPESFKVSRQLLFDSFANIDFKKPHPPLLLIAGESDHIFPPVLTKKIADKYTDKSSVVDYKMFANRSHFLCGEKGWEEIAGYILNWIETTN